MSISFNDFMKDDMTAVDIQKFTAYLSSELTPKQKVIDVPDLTPGYIADFANLYASTSC